MPEHILILQGFLAPFDDPLTLDECEQELEDDIARSWMRDFRQRMGLNEFNPVQNQ